jgi:CspA family cold shock protein
MPDGTVKWFSGRKGYGFIEPDGGGDDVFFHRDVVEDRKHPRDGQRVSYVVTLDERGLRAKTVVLVENGTD